MQIRSIARAARTLACCAPLFAIVASDAAMAADDAGRYRIIAGESEVRIQVFRAGPLARLGHNHVISTTDMTGTAFLGSSIADASVDVALPVSSFVVDDPDARAAEGQAFSGEMSEKQIRDTRKNMLGPKLLHAEAHDEIRVVSDSISGELPEITVNALITIKGTEHAVALPATVEVHEDGLIASGATDISHGELGLSPVTAALGSVRVADGMSFRYRIVARKSED